jgi:hypothetical protein
LLSSDMTKFEKVKEATIHAAKYQKVLQKFTQGFLRS